MNYLVQRGKVRDQMIKVPEGLPELLSDITREVLRCQPTPDCLCQFVIDYLQSVIETREKALVTQTIIERALRAVDEIIGDLCICDIGQEKAEAMALAMEECFKNFLRKRRCERGRDKEVFKFGEEDMLDELIKRCKFTVEELQKSQAFIENAYQRFVETYMQTADKEGGAEALYQYFKAREERRAQEKRENDAATIIQKNWRGYLVRKELNIQKRLKMCEDLRRAEEEAAELAFLEAMAIKIQRWWRSFLKKCSFMRMHDEDMEDFEDLCTPKSELSLDPYSTPQRGVRSKPETPKETGTPVAEVEVTELAEGQETKEEPEVTEDVPAAAESEAGPAAETPAEPEAAAEPEAEPAPPPEAEPEPEPAPTPAPEPEPEPQPVVAEQPAAEPEAAEAPAAEAEAPPAEEPAAE